MKTVSAESWAPSLKRNKSSQNTSDPLDIGGHIKHCEKREIKDG